MPFLLLLSYSGLIFNFPSTRPSVWFCFTLFPVAAYVFLCFIQRQKKYTFETLASLECAEGIIDQVEGVMVARGDLGLAVGYTRLPEAQDQLVAMARRAQKVSVIATQILENFAETGVPQRAELSDLSLAALQQADAIMLGKETVYSPRPIECIRLAREVLTHETLRFSHGSRHP